MALDVTDSQLEPHWQQEAQARGVILDIVLSEALILYKRTMAWRAKADETDRLLEEAADLVPLDTPPIPAEALRREHFYEK